MSQNQTSRESGVAFLRVGRFTSKRQCQCGCRMLADLWGVMFQKPVSCWPTTPEVTPSPRACPRHPLRWQTRRSRLGGDVQSRERGLRWFVSLRILRVMWLVIVGMTRALGSIRDSSPRSGWDCTFWSVGDSLLGRSATHDRTHNLVVKRLAALRPKRHQSSDKETVEG
jgi:hypothetical protein